ncbi:hypothetical protein PASE110613_09505 [Paenibacillus sediminis]|uniref:Uncharacterized protein n=1 Tax=Paenibacillus sediminis TaxID=664909 RepID=A0ABS4H5R5_9BACL|nr:hypothetical protein [Paenibacillus sediminis]MBP1937722.1 hypothetical protein [Paenibacillus sediminis]
MNPVVTLRPDLRTVNGEVQDIMFHNQYVGSLTLVYREGHRLAGGVHLDEENLPEHAKDEVINFIRDYVVQLSDAVATDVYEVFVTCSTVERIIDESGNKGLFNEEDENEEEMNSLPYSSSDIFVYDNDNQQLQLELISAGRNVSQYEVQDEEGRLLAEVTLKQYGADIVGTVEWKYDPSEAEIDAVVDLLIREWDDQEIDTFSIDMKTEEGWLERIELAYDDFNRQDNQYPGHKEDQECYVTLSRKDGEMLTYAVYERQRGGLPVGTATIDISGRQISGFIDFDIPGTSQSRQNIANCLKQELRKEKTFDALHLTMLYRNEVIDEILI